MSREKFILINIGGSVRRLPTAVDENDKEYYCGKNLCKFLEYHNIPQALHNNVSSKNKKKLEEILGKNSVFYHDEKSIYLDTDGVKQMLQKTKNGSLEIIKTISDSLKLDLNLVIPSKEKNTLESIAKSFPDIVFETQFRVEKYRIDMYCPKYNIAIECDEFGHKNRNKEYEMARQEKIIQILNCKMIRYDPDSLDFDIFKVIGKIFTIIYTNIQNGVS